MARLFYINNNGLQDNLKANIISNNEKKYYNISHGGKESWEIRYAMDNRLFKPKNNNDKLELIGNNFILKPIMDKSNKIIKDKQGNIYYVISKNNIPDHKKDTYIFLDTDIELGAFKYKNSPGVNIIGKGYRKDNNNIEYVSPVIEVFGKGWIELSDGNKTFRVEVSNENITFKEVKCQKKK